MNTIITIFVGAICVTGALASPVAPSDVQEEARTIYDTSSGMYLGLNTTVLVVAGVGLLVAVFAFLAIQQTGLLDDLVSTGSGYQQRYDSYQQQDHEPYRTKRSYNESKSIHLVQLRCMLCNSWKLN